MAQGTNELVPVGQVFKIFPGQHGFCYIGVNVALDGNPFIPHKELVFRPPQGEDVVLTVSTIEIGRKRANVANPGDSCAVRPSQVLAVVPDVGWSVLAHECNVQTARTRVQELTPRPVPPREVRNLTSHCNK